MPSTYTWGTKYRVQYYDVNEVQTIVNIKKKGYSGSVTYLTGTGSPVQLIYPGNESRIAGIYGAELKLNLWSETNYQFLEFFTSDNREYLVEYTKGGATQFKGFLITENYS